MSVVNKAKKIYTTRKASLNRLLDPILQLTQDGAASMDRLIEHRKECKLVWDQFVQAHDELVHAHPEDGDPDAAEFGSLEMRKAELMGTLAEVIARLNTERLNQEQRAKPRCVRVLVLRMGLHELVMGLEKLIPDYLAFLPVFYQSFHTSLPTLS